MPAWPSIQAPSYPFREDTTKRQVRTPFEAGYVHTRAAATVSRKTFQLTWKVLPEAEYQTLEAFFEDNIGGTFTWTHPLTLTAYNMRFSEGSLQSSIEVPGGRRVAVTIEEVP